MKTEDLINLMSQDAPVKLGYGRALAFAVVAGTLASVLLLTTTVGVRPGVLNAIETGRVMFKIAVTLLIAFLAARLAMRIGRPGAATRLPFLLLSIPLALVVAGVFFELVALPQQDWRASLVGQNAVFCVFFIPVLSLGPMAAFLWAMQKGAPENPTQAGIVAGLAAGSIAAAVYAWHCPDDSPLFLATWYAIAIALVTATGGVLGRRLLRW